MKKTSILPFFLFGLFFLAGGLQSQAQTYNYVPDSTFDQNGLKSFIFFNNIDRAFGCALQPDEKLIMTGMSKNPNTGSFELCVCRLHVNGEFDSTFSGDGRIFVSMGNQGSIGGLTPKIKLQQDGKLVIVNSGRAPSGGSQDMMICRIDSTGVLDATFNSTGVLWVDMTGANTQPDAANAVDIDSSGNIWAAGVTRTGSTPLDNDFAVVKVLPNGTLDPSFDTDGKKLFNPSGFAEFSRGIKVQTDGKIVVGGTAGSNMYLIRFDSTGVLDPTFNTTGTVNIQFQTSSDMGAMSIDNNGKIVVAGKLITSNSNVATARYLPTGLFDPTYGFNGKYFYNIGNSATVINDIHIGPTNKITLGGFVRDSAQLNNFIATRIESNGTLDLTFNGLGVVSQAVIPGAVDEEGNGLAVLADDRIMVTGTIVYSSAINEDIGVFRMKPVLVTGLQPSLAETSIRVYPNPFTAQLRVISKSDTPAEILDITGKLIRSVTLVAGINDIDGTDLQPGMYMVRVPGERALQIVKH
ncbi:MAG: T9SS type A sorting domain-containing protein [Bacteroidia bacterium]|jgi:uncharacterized delta-60 repeat protein|nr:T9SS type A sorting domain-containing protein [Bacteroidia bacterium]